MMRRRLWVLWAAVALSAVFAAGATWLWSEEDGASPPGAVATETPHRPTPTPIPVVFDSFAQQGMSLPGVSLAVRPESAFPPWHGLNAVIYDTRSGRPIDLGPGSGVSFSPDGRYAAWIAGDVRVPNGTYLTGEARVITLATGNQRVIGKGVAVIFPDASRLALQLPRGPLENAEWRLFDVDDLQPSADQTTPGHAPRERRTSTGHILRSEPVAGTELPRGGSGTTSFSLLDPTDGHVVLAFDAFQVADATSTELVVANAWSDVPPGAFHSINVQLYFLDVTNGLARRFATARASTPNWNLSANDKYVLWTNDFCSEDGATEVVLFDRASSTGFSLIREGGDEIRTEPESNESWLFLTPSGLIAEGTFGATALIDPAARTYVSVLPKVQLVTELQDKGPVQPTWSKDYRYAAYGQVGGHGGLC